MRWPAKSLLLMTLVAATPVDALADGPATAPPATDATLARLEHAQGSPITWNDVPAGRSEHFGHSEVLVAAPLPYVREQALDFGHYRELSGGRIRTSRVVDKQAQTTDVYLQVPVLHGMVMLWEVLRFSDVRRAPDGTESFVGRLVSGNVQSAEMQITMRPVSGGRTVLRCDLHVAPKFAAPQSAVDAEVRDAAESAVVAVRERALGKYGRTAPRPNPALVADHVSSHEGADAGK
jgi:hypothetical protein